MKPLGKLILLFDLVCPPHLKYMEIFETSTDSKVSVLMYQTDTLNNVINIIGNKANLELLL